MDDETSDWGMGPRPEEDLEYDLAHEAVGAAAGVDSAAGSTDDGDDPDPSGLTYVATETPEYGGDYSYDMSHDVPGR